MKIKLLMLSLVALCGVAVAAEITTHVESNGTDHKVTAVDKNGTELGAVKYNSSTCFWLSIPDRYLANGRHSQEAQEEIKMALLKATLNHGYKNGCADTYFHACKEWRNRCEKAGAIVDRWSVQVAPKKWTGKIKALFGSDPF